MANPVAMAEVSTSVGDLVASNDAPALAIADFVADDEPSAFLKLSMSRRIKEALIAEPKLRDFLANTLDGDADAVKQVVYSASARRVALVEFCTTEQAATCRERLHDQPCALLQGRAMYAEFVLPRKLKESREQLRRVPSVSRSLALSDPSARVPGLQFTREFVSEEQERGLLAFLDRDDGRHWEKTVRARQVQHFGFVFNYDTRRCDLPESGGVAEAGDTLAMPPQLTQLVQQIVDADAMDGHAPDQITVNEYLPGQGIAAHIDTHAAFTTAIASLSLENEIVMEFRRPDADGALGVEPVLLPPRSLVVMTGASRYEWTHAIQPRLFDVIDGVHVDRRRRLSITFRKVQTTPCTCAFPVQCAAQERFEQERLRKLKLHEKQQQQETAQTRDESLAPTAVEKEFVHAFYETVADHFSSTRYNPWPRIKQFVQALPFGSVVADLGCGNGKYMLCIDPAQSVAVGGDRSARLAQICGARGLNALVCDAMRVPIRSASCDAALSIAVLHHLSTEHHRVAAVKEVIRVLRIGGRGVIYAWAHEQQRGSRRRFEEDRQDFMVPWNLDKRFVRKDGGHREEEETKEQEKSSTAAVVQRFCHMFKQGELEQLVGLAGDAQVEESYYDESNWAVVLRRTS
jgi:alkylated DNA repair protein alkB family protein 8